MEELKAFLLDYARSEKKDPIDEEDEDTKDEAKKEETKKTSSEAKKDRKKPYAELYNHR
jgi:hypothetical protein